MECFCFVFVPSQGQRTSTLSCLLAGGNDDDIAEWSESMATPPLKIKEPAGGMRSAFQVLMVLKQPFIGRTVNLTRWRELTCSLRHRVPAHHSWSAYLWFQTFSRYR